MGTNQIAKWQGGQKYRGRAVEGEITIEILKSVNQTRVVEVMLECTTGDMSGRRMKWRGWINSPQNAERTRESLVAMGWRGGRWGDWTGIGSREIEWTATAEKKMVEGEERTYWLAAFVRTLARIVPKNPATTKDIDDLNRLFPPTANGAGAGVREPSDAAEAPPVTEGTAAPADDIPF